MPEADDNGLLEKLQALTLALDEHAIVSMADAAGRITYVNQKFCDVSGFALEELLGENHSVVKSGYHDPGFFRGMWQTIASGRVWHGEVKNRRKDGGHYWVETTIVPFLDATGRPERYVSVRTEITRLMELEDSLSRSNELLRVGIQERTRELEAAKAELEVELQRRLLDQASLKTSYDELRSLHQRLQATQQHLLQSERLAAVGQLAAGLAHEINNPIGFIYSNLTTLGRYLEQLLHAVDQSRHVLDTVSERATGPDARALCTSARDDIQALDRRLDLVYLREDSRALVAETLDGLDRVRRVVQNLRDFSQVDNDDRWHWCEPARCIENALNLVPADLLEGIDIVRRYGVLPEIQCHPAQLNQVFHSLLVNALQAMAGQGTLSLASTSQGSLVVLEVADTGHGIPAEHLPRIFEPFFTTRPIGQGSGLGLSLAYGLVKQHGGDIRVSSRQGQGTAVQVLLPVEHVDAAPSPRPGLDAARAESMS